jgi:hypothetical protein
MCHSVNCPVSHSVLQFGSSVAFCMCFLLTITSNYSTRVCWHKGEQWFETNWEHSIGFWRWCITHRINGFSDFVHRLDSKELEDKNTTFRKLDLFSSSGEGRHIQWLTLALSKGPNRVSVSLHFRTEIDPVSEMSCSSNSLETKRWTKSENPIIPQLKACSFKSVRTNFPMR